jgi:hypothetical protein
MIRHRPDKRNGPDMARSGTGSGRSVTGPGDVPGYVPPYLAPGVPCTLQSSISNHICNVNVASNMVIIVGYSFRPHCRAGILPRGFLHRLWLIGVLCCCCYLWRLILGYLDLDQHPLDLLPLVPPDPGAFGWAVPSKLIEVSGWR